MAKTKKKFYVVWKGRTPGIYKTWGECKTQTNGFNGARFKSFPSISEAEVAFGGASKPISTSQESPKPSAKKPLKTEDDAFDLFCDGGCSPNPGPSGTGLAIYQQGILQERWCGHHDPEGTNNRAELLGIVEALNYTQALVEKGLVTTKKKAIIHCDSQYAINCITKWAKSWRRNGWLTQKGEPVRNQDIIETGMKAFASLNDLMEIRKVKGHSGIPGNEMADDLAGIAQFRKIKGWDLLH